MKRKTIKKIISPIYKLRYRLKSSGWIYVGAHTKIDNSRNVHLGNGVQIAPYCLICPHGDSIINLDDNVNIGMFSRIACINGITIGKNVLTGPHVFISDYNHEYRDVSKPICEQGNNGTGKVVIGDDCWIGTNVVICGDVTIGKHVVIGAGAFINRDIPDFTVVVGNPAKVVKKYNFENGLWERV